MTYHDRVMKLRAEKKRMGFSFRFEDLFSEEELLNMTVAQRKTAEKSLFVKLITCRMFACPLAVKMASK